MKSVLSISAVVAAAALGSGCVVVDSQGHIARDEKRFTVSGPPDLRLGTFDGSIQIRSGGDREVRVEIEKRGPTEQDVNKLQVTATQDGNSITVEVKKPEGETYFGIGFNVAPTARLIVTMPKSGNVVARSGDGSIRIEDVNGKLDLRTGDGSIKANRIGGDLTVESGDGSIALDGISGRLQIQTSDGSVTIAGRPEVVRAHTGDGSITFRAENGTKMADDWSMTTGDGSISLYLPGDFAADLDASTGDGTIRSELNVDGTPERERRALRGRIGSGGRQLKVRSGDGSIKLRASQE
jgi:DUF4097 and DUF4098 domain-containing protein YvlB